MDNVKEEFKKTSNSNELNESLVFAVIGAGNTGQALAGYLTYKGHKVRLYDRSAWRFKYLRHHNMNLGDAFSSSQHIDVITTDLRRAVEGADVIIISVVSTAHAEVAQKLSQFLKNGQVVLLHPGRTGGAFIFKKVVEETKKDLRLTIGEFETSLFATRITQEGAKVRYYGVKKNVHLAMMPPDDAIKVWPLIKNIFPQVEMAPNVLYTSLSNYGAMLHPAPVIFNVGRIENGFRYTHYIEGITPSIARFIEKLDSERIKLGKCFNIRLRPLTVWLSDVYGSKGNNLFDLLQNTKAYHSILGPDTIQHRYLIEDTLTGLVPMLHLARKCEVRLPAIETLVNMINYLVDIDVMAFGRNLEDMGLRKMKVEEIIKYAESGVKE